MMPTSMHLSADTTPFTFTVRLDEEFWEGMELDCGGETAANEAARDVLQAKLDHRPPHAGNPHRGLVGVGIGSWLEAPDWVIWPGEWEWSADEGGRCRCLTSSQGAPLSQRSAL